MIHFYVYTKLLRTTFSLDLRKPCCKLAKIVSESNFVLLLRISTCFIHNNKIKLCSFLVVPGNGQVLLGMPDIETQGILTFNYNRIDTKEVDEAEKCRTNTANSQETTS